MNKTKQNYAKQLSFNNKRGKLIPTNVCRITFLELKI